VTATALAIKAVAARSRLCRPRGTDPRREADVLTGFLP
jgi:hypothetical protein